MIHIKNKEVDVIIKGLKYLYKQHNVLHLVDIEDSNLDIVKIQI